MAEYSIFTLCSKNYRDAYDFVIDTWLKTSAKYIYIYTDDETWKSDNDRIKIIKLFDESDDWLVNVGRKYQVVEDVVKFGDKSLMFIDIDCYIVNDVGYLFDENDFDFAVTRLYNLETEINSGLYFFHNTEHNRTFINDWAMQQEKYYKMGIGVKPYAGSFSQMGFSDTLRRYNAQGTHKIMDLDPRIYHRKVGKPQQRDSAIEVIKQKKVEILHFYARTWRNADAVELLSYLDNSPTQGKLCVTTVVNRKYQKYIPMFIYFCLKSYPDYGIKLFLTEQLKPGHANVVDKLRGLGTIEILENCYSSFPKRDAHELKTLRWLTISDDFEGYDYVYTGDIDIVICREEKSLLDQHLDNCERLNLPYSNSVRPNSRRLSGLQFVKKDEYYAKMDDVIKKYRERHKRGQLRGTKNEEVLYNMVRKAGLGMTTEWFRPHHGLHLGRWRKGELKVPEKFWMFARKDDYRGYYEFYKSLKEDPLYQEVYRTSKLPEMGFMDRSLDREF